MFQNCIVYAVFILIFVELIPREEGRTSVLDLHKKPTNLKQSCVEIKSVLVPCSNKEEDKHHHSKQSSESRDTNCGTRGHDDSLLLNPLITDCKRKMLVSMKFNIGEVRSKYLSIYFENI